ncbi:MAG: hypothetical protein L7S63_04070, partial [Flavobacteriales bacterium]|nr:hypothetical protein [Flavobacteriales bacterium]
MLLALHSISQCADPSACNFDSEGDTSDQDATPCLTLETHMVHETGPLSGKTTYRLYVNLPESDNFLSAISTILTGCTEIGACNYSPTASYDDGSCDYESCEPSGIPADEDANTSQIRITTTTDFYQDNFGSLTSTAI